MAGLKDETLADPFESSWTLTISATFSFRRGLGHAAFMAVMLGSSLFAIARMGAVTFLLPIESFGVYAMLVAAGAFLSGPLSFGIVEATVKRFPRLVADGREEEMVADSRIILRILALRSLIPGISALTIAFATGVDWMAYVGAAFLLAFSTSANGLVASMQRGRMQPHQLAAGTAIRAVLAAAAVTLASLSGDLVVVLIAEFAAMLGAALLTRRIFFGYARPSENSQIAMTGDVTDGRLIFAAFTIISIPFYLDRTFVAAALGLQSAAQYGVLALFLLGASLLIATVGQRAGPEAIVLIHKGTPAAAIVRTIGWMTFTSATWLAFIVSFWVILHFGWLPQSLARYALTTEQLIPIAATGILLNTGMLELLLIGLDRERALARNSVVFLAAVALAAVLAVTTSASLVIIMWLLAGARAIYAIALTWAVVRATRPSRHVRPNHHA